MLDDNTVPFPMRKTQAERLSALSDVLDHLDTELPAVIVEALFDAANLVGAGVAALLQAEDGELYATYATDPSILDQRIDSTPESILSTFKVSDAIMRHFRCDETAWLLVFGGRGGALDRPAYQANEKTIIAVFNRLLRRRNNEAAGRTYIDHLTGLPDRSATMERLGETTAATKRNNERAAVLFVDVNGFKQINDSYGHARGDRVLKEIASCMRDALRSHEFVGRIGGDEFAVILPNIRNAQDAEHVAQRLWDGVNQLRIEGNGDPVTLGIGIALFPDHASNQEDWLNRADMAMYRAKRMKVPYCIFELGTEEGECGKENPGIDESYAQQFLLCFQPIFNVESRRIVAVEALVRWLHPEEGMLSAASAVKAARQWQNSENLDLWVIRKVLNCLSRWERYGIGSVHVNVTTLSEQTLHALVHAIATSDADPSKLAIELESPTSPEHADNTRRFADVLSKAGVRVGIDGFGSTNFNLQYLESLNVRFVKLANTLLPSSGASGKGIHAAVAMAGAMNWDVIATRVVTAEDRRAIRDSGVTAMQGYAFAQPMTAIDFEQWIENSQGMAFLA